MKVKWKVGLHGVFTEAFEVKNRCVTADYGMYLIISLAPTLDLFADPLVLSHDNHPPDLYSSSIAFRRLARFALN